MRYPLERSTAWLNRASRYALGTLTTAPCSTAKPTIPEPSGTWTACSVWSRRRARAAPPPKEWTSRARAQSSGGEQRARRRRRRGRRRRGRRRSAASPRARASSNALRPVAMRAATDASSTTPRRSPPSAATRERRRTPGFSASAARPSRRSAGADGAGDGGAKLGGRRLPPRARDRRSKRGLRTSRALRRLPAAEGRPIANDPPPRRGIGELASPPPSDRARGRRRGETRGTVQSNRGAPPGESENGAGRVSPFVARATRSVRRAIRSRASWVTRPPRRDVGGEQRRRLRHLALAPRCAASLERPPCSRNIRRRPPPRARSARLHRRVLTRRHAGPSQGGRLASVWSAQPPVAEPVAARRSRRRAPPYPPGIAVHVEFDGIKPTAPAAASRRRRGQRDAPS